MVKHSKKMWSLSLMGDCINNVDNSSIECTFFQVDPRCHVQYLYWFHERGGRKRLIKTGRNSTEPYVHEIDEVGC